MGMGKKITGQRCWYRDHYIIQHCKKKRVLHVGCTDYPFFKTSFAAGDLLHEKVNKVASKVIGIDIASDDIAQMVTHGYDVREIDAQKMHQYKWDEKFDVILLADVLEHIPNPGLVISAAKHLLSPQGKILVTVPNAFGIVRYIKSIFRYEQVHPDHIAYYSSGVLETLAANMELKVQQSNWYRFEVRDKRLIVYISAAFERFVTLFFPWYGEGCITLMSLVETTE